MSHRISRRKTLSAITLAALFVSTLNLNASDEPRVHQGTVSAISMTGDSHPGLKPFDDLMTSFLIEHNIPGASLAVMNNGHLVYARGFGMADRETSQPVKPDSLFRIASISKPITAVAIMQLVEQGVIKMDQAVFEILPSNEWFPDKAQYDARLMTITIRQLLQHTGGWDRSVSFDPIGKAREMSRELNKTLPMSASDVVRYTLTLPLDFDPGSRFAYANVDYLLLGRVIEKISGKPYETYVKEKVLSPAGATRTQLGRAWKDDLAKDEVRYYDSKKRSGLAINGSRLNENVPIVYGAENFEAYEAHGGWISSAVDLVRFASSLDDTSATRLLTRESVGIMFSRPDGLAGYDDKGTPRDFYYGCGWNVRPIGNEGKSNTWHAGLIAGTSTLLVRRHDGLTWAVLFNTEATSEGKALSGIIDPLIHRAADAVTQWPAGVFPK